MEDKEKRFNTHANIIPGFKRCPKSGAFIATNISGTLMKLKMKQLEELEAKLTEKLELLNELLPKEDK